MAEQRRRQRNRKAGKRPNGIPVDEGCLYAPSCVSCPWRVCIVEDLSRPDVVKFAAAYRRVVAYLAPVAANADAS
jgi:hypothetical protein